VEVLRHTLLISTLDGNERLASHPGHLFTGYSLRYRMNRMLGGQPTCR